MKIKETASILIRNIDDDLGLAITQQGTLALLAYYEGRQDIPVNQERLALIKDELKMLSDYRKAGINNFAKELQQKHIAPQLFFCNIYDSQLKIWKEVKACYKKNKGYENCLDMIKVQFPLLPYKLIEKLTDPDPYESQPSTLALLMTAKITNIPENLSKRYLQDYLKGSRNLMKTASREEVENALSRYEEYVIEEDEWKTKNKALLPNPKTLSSET